MNKKSLLFEKKNYLKIRKRSFKILAINSEHPPPPSHIPSACTSLNKTETILRLIKWCFTPLSTVFQSYHGDNSHYPCLSWVSPVLGWGSEVSCPNNSQERDRSLERSFTVLYLIRDIVSEIIPSPQDNFSDWSKLKAFADVKINGTKKMKLVLGKEENIVGKEENAGYQHFLLFPQCFQKGFISWSLKVGIVW